MSASLASQLDLDVLEVLPGRVADESSLKLGFLRNILFTIDSFLYTSDFQELITCYFPSFSVFSGGPWIRSN